MAGYLFAVIDRAIATQAALFKQANPQWRAVSLRRASASFQHGVASRVAARLGSMHTAREASVRAQRSAGTVLILAKHTVVEQAFRATDVRLVSLTAIGRRRIASAFRDGLAAGERVNLNRPVSSDRSGLLA